jgi:2,3-bisphosphoglycerate-dependent phosphoglycerate mutase
VNPARTTIILIRHGVTDWNQDRRFQGQIDIPLNPAGLRQAGLTAERFGADETLADVAAVHSSDLARAAQTAEPIARRLGLPMQLDPLLRERHYGVFQGLTGDEIVQRHPEAWRRWLAREPAYDLPGGGESLLDFHARVERVLEGLVVKYRSRTVVAVAHGGVLDCAFRIAAGLALDAARHHDLFNASINRIEHDGERFRLVHWGDVSHLGQALDDVEARG